MSELTEILARDKAARQRLHQFEREADSIGRAFWLDPRTLRHNLIRALETAYQDGRVHEAFNRRSAP